MLAFITIFCSSFVIALSGAMMPGPLLTATISESSRQGYKAGPLMIAGHGLLELILVCALLFGLAPLLQRREVFIATAILGAIILFWMGINMLKSLPNLQLQQESTSEKRHHLLLTGIVLSLANPYWTIWWVSIGLGYILYSLKFGPLGVLAFFTGHIMADLAWYATVSYAIHRGRRLMTDRLYRGIIGTCAIFLLVFGCYFAYSGYQRILS